MWPKKYKDYPEDQPLIKNQVESGDGIVGVEMHEVNGWDTTNHKYRRKRFALTEWLLAKINKSN